MYLQRDLLTWLTEVIIVKHDEAITFVSGKIITAWAFELNSLCKPHARLNS